MRLASLVKLPIAFKRSFQNPNPLDDKINPNKSVEQNPNTSTFIVNKAKSKKARRSELDKLHADISKMFDCKAVLNATNIRKCRTNKTIDYVNSNIEELNPNDNKNKLKKQFYKKSMANTSSPLDFDNLVGFLPLIKSGQIISKNKENQNQQLTVTNVQKQSDSSFSIQKIYNQQNIDEIVQKSIVDERVRQNH